MEIENAIKDFLAQHKSVKDEVIRLNQDLLKLHYDLIKHKKDLEELQKCFIQLIFYSIIICFLALIYLLS